MSSLCLYFCARHSSVEFVSDVPTGDDAESEVLPGAQQLLPSKTCGTFACRGIEVLESEKRTILRSTEGNKDTTDLNCKLSAGDKVAPDNYH